MKEINEKHPLSEKIVKPFRKAANSERARVSMNKLKVLVTVVSRSRLIIIWIIFSPLG